MSAAERPAETGRPESLESPESPEGPVRLGPLVRHVDTDAATGGDARAL